MHKNLRAGALSLYKRGVIISLPFFLSCLLIACGESDSSSSDSNSSDSSSQDTITACDCVDGNVVLNSNSFSRTPQPHVAIDSSGTAIAVWNQNNGLIDNVYYSRNDGCIWAESQVLATNNAIDFTSNPRVSFDGVGNATAIWLQSDTTRNHLYSSRFDGSEWNIAENIETGSGGVEIARVATDFAGNAIAVWEQREDGVVKIFGNRFDGSNWGINERLHTDFSGFAKTPEIAFDANGNAIVVWSQSDGIRENIWFNYFNGISWGIAELLESDDSGDAKNPQIIFNSNNTAIAVWSQSDGVRSNIWASHFDGSSWGAAILLESDNAGNAESPQIAVAADSQVTVVWQQSDGIRSNIWANHFNGTNWGTAELLETDNVGDAVTPQIAANSSGSAIAIWSQSDGVQFSIWSNRFDGTNWSGAVLLESNDSGDALLPQIDYSDSGRAIAVWQQLEGSGTFVISHCFD